MKKKKIFKKGVGEGYIIKILSIFLNTSMKQLYSKNIFDLLIGCNEIEQKQIGCNKIEQKQIGCNEIEEKRIHLIEFYYLNSNSRVYARSIYSQMLYRGLSLNEMYLSP